MKTITLIFFFTFMFSNIELNADSPLPIDTTSFSYFNGITDQRQIVKNYKITNNSNEEYLTWVSLVPTNNKSNIELMHDFFKKRKGDFNLIEMINENLLDGLSINIGYSFIKNILAGKTFSYVFVTNNSNLAFYKDRIVVISKKEVEQFLKFQIEKKYFFQFEYIVLAENYFTK